MRASAQSVEATITKNGQEIELDAYALIGAIHETCQADGYPLAQCVPRPAASFALEAVADQAVLDAYPGGVRLEFFAPDLGMNQGGDFRKVTLTDTSVVRVDREYVKVPDGLEVSFFVYDATVETSNIGQELVSVADKQLNIRQSAPDFDQGLRRVRVTEDIDGIALAFDHW